MNIRDLSKEKADFLKERNDKSVFKAHLLPSIGHEMRTPIHAIGGIANFLENNWDNTNDQTKKQAINNIAKVADTLGELVNSLFDPLRYNSHGIECIFKQENLITATKLAIKQSKAILAINKKITIKFETALPKCHAEIDIFWFKQLLFNLISNAIKFSEEGNVAIILKEVTKDNQEYFIFSVIDQGIGVNEEELDRIFSPYIKGSRNVLKNNYGMGLGLSICTAVVLAHNGRITAKNNSDTGATFEFMIPK